jgi:hypothetical protein
MTETNPQSQDYERALQNPIAVYSRPAQLLADSRLDTEQKLAVLRRWEADCRELQVAEEEGMIGADADLFPEVLQAIHELLPADAEPGHIEAPTKQGGSH